jgi:hypothetical protein
VPSRAEAQPVAPEQREPLRAECEHFLHCLRTRSARRTDGRRDLCCGPRAVPAGARRDRGGRSPAGRDAAVLRARVAFVDDG